MTDIPLHLQKYVPCPVECGWMLCFLDRTYDECTACGTTLPVGYRLDLQFQPISTSENDEQR